MSAPLPSALRVRFQQYVEEGLSGRAAALRLKLSPATGARWALAIRRTGRAAAAPQGRPKGKGKLDPNRSFLAEVIKHDGDITMPELSAALHDATGVSAHPNAIGKFLRKLGYTYKKVTGRHRTPPCQGKAAARRLVQAPYSSRDGAAGTRCLYLRNIREDKPDQTAGMVVEWGAPDHGRPVRVMGHPDLHRRAERR